MMAVPGLAPFAMTQRRFSGIVMRYGATNAQLRPEKPSDIARHIEKVAKEFGEHQRKRERKRCAQLIDTMCAYISEYTAMEVRAVAHGMPLIFGKDIDDKWVQTIATYTLKRANMMPAYLLYPLANSISRMGKSQCHILEQLVGICIKRINEANSIDLATIAQTAILLKRNKGVNELMEAVANATLAPNIIAEISATNAVLILYAFAQIGMKHEGLFEALLDVITKLNHEDFQVHLIPLALHSLAKFKYKNHRALHAVTDHALQVVHKMQPENLSSTIYALARLMFNQQALVREIAKKTAQHLPNIGVRELSNIFWGLAKLRHDDLPLANDIIDRVIQYDHIDNMSFAQIFEGMRCYHMVDKRDAISTLLKRYKTIMPSCSTQIVTQVAWCCCSLGYWGQDIIPNSLEELCLRDRSKKEQKYVEMLLEALKVHGFQPEDTIRHYNDKMRASRQLQPT
ncbi:hypothetical protein X943_000009 [Babesia divergens]|uniref:RNA-editing substrate-binding complex 6 protein domain-containing protein n=1 Tax=Babesia divergens TaxID=32595 RepID=A0AAD9LJU8_BABDI|nr:hypothetical protein X943_000009 [Babesia divergens]